MFSCNKMREETIQPNRGTNLRKNGNEELKLFIDSESLQKIFLVNGTSKINIIEEGVNHKKKRSIPLKILTPTYSDQVNKLVNEFRQKPFLVQNYLRFIDFIIHEYYIYNREIDNTEIKKEFGEINRNLFAKWNISCLEIIDDDKIYPTFLTKFLS